jgi:Flp pilus assembly secretin CpaC
MTESCRKPSCHKYLLLASALLSTMGLCGCQDWPDERSTAIEAQNILHDLSRIETIPDPNIPRPAIYKSPPKKLKQIVGGAEEWKLVYFCRYHTAEEMKKIISEQFATKLFDEKGKSTQVTDYTVTANPATNQLVVRCPLEPDVDAVMEIIQETDIPPVQVRIDCLVSELYADLTVDRETSMMIQNLFGEGIKLSGQENNNNLAFPGAELRDPARAKFGLKIGISRDDFTALVDILVSRGYMKILMNPSLEVVNGETARIQSKQHQPLQQITVQSGGFGGVPVLTTQTEYYDIIDSLQITPHVYADGYIGLETEAQIAAYLTPEGIKQTPNVTERTITNKDNRIRLGESLIIGGIRKSEKRDVIRGVPILKDIPGLNVLFSGRDFEARATEVIFILTPSISTGGKPNDETVDMLHHRHAAPVTQSIEEKTMDPLGLKAREREKDRQVEVARQVQQQSEAEATAARLKAIETAGQVDQLLDELRQAKDELKNANAKTDEAMTEARQAREEARNAVAAAEKAKLQMAQASAAAKPEPGQAAQAKAPPENKPSPEPPASQPKAAAAPPAAAAQPPQSAPTPQPAAASQPAAGSQPSKPSAKEKEADPKVAIANQAPQNPEPKKEEKKEEPKEQPQKQTENSKQDK